MKFPFYVRIAMILLSVVLVFIMLSAAANVIIPLLFALLISILIFPVNRFFEKKLRMGRVVAAILTVTLFVLLISVFFYLLVVQLTKFANDFPALQVRFNEMYANVQHWISMKLHITTRQQTAYLNRSGTKILDTMAQSVREMLLSLSGILLLFIFIFIFTFFILYYRKLLINFILNLFSPQHRHKVQEVVLETKGLINAYISGLVIEMLLMGIVSCIMFLIMDIRYPILLGVTVALLNVIPYLGIFTAICLCMIVTFANSTGLAAVQAGIGLTILHLLDSNILFPRIIGWRVKMNPFITILAVITGEYLWGIPGMFLFIPITGVIKLVCERVEGLHAWGILIGVEEKDAAAKPVVIEPSAKEEHP